ncbi:MAG: hypothetical protein BWY80_00802 [Firmicutes bacterium ADurb.Bin456]|nr:MAG: hypothetical protein BWY80_00802 [Firmicutes bacterium ADurb.Bin456]
MPARISVDTGVRPPTLATLYTVMAVITAPAKAVRGNAKTPMVCTPRPKSMAAVAPRAAPEEIPRM